MRVTADQIEGRLTHAFSRAELRARLAKLPSEWIQEIRHVRLMASLKNAETFGLANYSKVTKKLVVYSRGKDKSEVLREIVRTLYLSATRSHSTHLSPAERVRLDMKLAPFFRAVEEEPNQSREPTRAAHL